MIKLLKILFVIFYRVWFYILVAVPIIVFFPVLLFLSASERFYPQFFWVARNLWARFVLFGMGMVPRFDRQEEMVKGKSYMLIANHTSMTDIMLMLHASKNPFVFVGKKELVKIPVFGFFYKRACIMVDRGCARSRSGVYIRAQKRLGQGLSICIFPEGGVPEEEVILDAFKDGAFKLAIEHRIPVVPMTFYDNKKRFPWSFFKGSPGKLRVKVHRFIPTKNMELTEFRQLKDRCRELILLDLKEMMQES